MVYWGGVLKGQSNDRRAMPAMQQAIEIFRPQLEAYEALCDKLAENPANVALAWLLHNPVVTAPITGPRVVAQLTEALRALEITLSVETLSELDKIWPGPGGEAPQAYSW